MKFEVRLRVINFSNYWIWSYIIIFKFKSDVFILFFFWNKFLGIIFFIFMFVKMVFDLKIFVGIILKRYKMWIINNMIRYGIEVFIKVICVFLNEFDEVGLLFLLFFSRGY